MKKKFASREKRRGEREVIDWSQDTMHFPFVSGSEGSDGLEGFEGCEGCKEFEGCEEFEGVEGEADEGCEGFEGEVGAS